MSVKSADRILDILELLASTGRALTHSEIARRSGIPKSSLSQLLRNLVERGYVELELDCQVFRLGEEAFALARRGVRTRKLIELANPHLQALTDETGESSGLYILNDDMAERVCSVNSKHALLYALHPGVRAPLFAHSGGKVFLAWMSNSDRESYLQRVKLVALTDKTIRSNSMLRRQIQCIRADGIAYSLGEFTPGVVGVAVPILDVHGRVLASVGVALPASRFNSTRLVLFAKELHICARAIIDAVEQQPMSNQL